ncbi:NADH-quinone oxidoreductase subunit NuoE [Oceanirhabdus seepicola]|uniref:NADH-quinone oxidoreductase subunit NuoE n=1 Tax=Oceanirhabdus seepicola TaxID=2828781 RepID=A0A9J6P6K8_9CLOT|nr:NADH-quinone oxidoreductase subunit NuoE [Oceanirhabdus seepicola]MCM1992375.1 NADH-quinone oxidoreductase subunit NuoE [Oceanirhabdus seepicola]
MRVSGCNCNCGCSDNNAINTELIKKAREIIDSKKNMVGPLIPVLHGIQDEFGYLPEEVLKIVSEELNVSLSEIYGVATFYSFFSLEPKGEYVIRVCIGTACYVKGSQKILDKLSEDLNVEVGKTSEDGKFTLEGCRCIGACGLAPVITINDKVYGRLVPEDIDDILKEYK